VFVGCGAPRGRDLDLPGRKEAAASIHIGIDWLASVSFGHITQVGKRVIVLGGGNTAMDCCRSARRLGGSDVKVIVRSGFEEMKASPWEKEDAQHEGIPIINYHVPKAFVQQDGKLQGMTFEIVQAVYDARAGAAWCPRARPMRSLNATKCWWPWARKTPFPGSSATAASPLTNGACRCWARKPTSPAWPTCSLAAMRLWPQEHHHGRGARA
jgi:hypothetical protein